MPVDGQLVDFGLYAKFGHSIVLGKVSAIGKMPALKFKEFASDI